MAVFDVPLVNPQIRAVFHRLDPAGTRAVNPPGAGTAGYDDDLNEPLVYDAPVGGARTDARTELAAVRVPCQVENYTEDRLRQAVGGDASLSNMVLVLHRRALSQLGLLDANQDIVLHTNDRVSTLERISDGVVVQTLGPEGQGLYVHEVRGASYGMGTTGYNLHLVFLRNRPQAEA